MNTLDLIITFDTEDVYTPASAGMDDVPRRLADILYQEGLPANFMLVAQRARLLKERGRQDVIASLQRHSIGVHTLNAGQPYDAVEAAKHDWAGGLEVCRPPAAVDLWRFSRQPDLGPDLGRRYAALAESLLVEPNLNTGSLYRHGKLQSWTLAPAWHAGRDWGIGAGA